MKKLNGYRASHRNKWRLIQHGILNIQELSLLEFYVDITDFDKEHETFGRFSTNFPEIAKIFNCKSDNTVRNWHKKLINSGFIKPTHATREYEFVCFLRYIPPGFWGGEAAQYASREKDKPVAKILQIIGVKLQNIGQKVQPVGEKKNKTTLNTTLKALGSFKDDSNVIPVKKVLIKQEVRSEEEYQRIYEENPNLPIPDDMRWIDENVTETIEVSKENEAEIVDIYFDGDWNKYQNNLIT